MEDITPYNLTPKQEKLLAALLTVPTVRQAAEQAGIGETTAWRMLKEPAFEREFRRRRRAAVDHATSLLQQTATQAVATLRRNLKCGNAQTEVTAARAVLEFAIKAIEQTEIIERLEELENAVKK